MIRRLMALSMTLSVVVAAQAAEHNPGGDVTGLPGDNAAQVLLADVGLPAWAPPAIEHQLQSVGGI